MDILFLHPNFPGQFRLLAQALAQSPQHHVWGLGDAAHIAKVAPVPGVDLLHYPAVTPANPLVHPWARGFEAAVRRAEAALQALKEHKARGLEPDVIVAHPGWGDAFFVRQLFPGARVIGYFEYFYHFKGADVGFDPEFPSQMNDLFRLHISNATQLLALESCDQGICPTQWQYSRFPSAYESKLQVLHEGIDTQRLKPDPSAQFTLPNGRRLHAGDEVLTFVSRHLEPYRGFHTFMRALPQVLKERPNCQVVIAGHEHGQGYGPLPQGGGTWKSMLESTITEAWDRSRVHFVGHLRYEDYIQLLQTSRAHVYLTYPFVLSWSLLEAMSCGCTVIASDTAPVREMVQHATHGLVFPFKDTVGLAKLACSVLANPIEYLNLGIEARKLIVERLDFSTVTLPAWQKILADA